jgi:hypothetical protein
VDSLDRKMAKIMARLAESREACPACAAREERAGIMQFDGELPRPEAERLAKEAHPCQH